MGEGRRGLSVAHIRHALNIARALGISTGVQCRRTVRLGGRRGRGEEEEGWREDGGMMRTKGNMGEDEGV